MEEKGNTSILEGGLRGVKSDGMPQDRQVEFDWECRVIRKWKCYLLSPGQLFLTPDSRIKPASSALHSPSEPLPPMAQRVKNPTRIERDTYTPMFIAALFTIARTWKQPRCPSADEWIRKLWYIYTMEYYSAIKKNSLSVLMRWMKLEPIIQSEVSQKNKDQYSILTHIYGI